MFLVARWQSYFGRNVSMAVLMIKGTPGVMMWVLNVVAISKPPKSDRWLSLVFGGLFCCIRKSFIFICNKEFCTCLYVCMLPSLSSIIIYLPLCKVEVLLRGWIDSSADRGQLLASGSISQSLTPHQQQVIHTNPPNHPQLHSGFCSHLPLNHHNSPLMLNFDLRVSKQAWLFYVCDCMERRHSGSAGCVLIPGSELWTQYVGDRKLLA